MKVTIPSLPGMNADDQAPIQVACGRAYLPSSPPFPFFIFIYPSLTGGLCFYTVRYTAVVTKKGEVFTFGSGDEGELGHGVLRSTVNAPAKVVFPEDMHDTYVYLVSAN